MIIAANRHRILKDDLLDGSPKERLYISLELVACMYQFEGLGVHHAIQIPIVKGSRYDLAGSPNGAYEIRLCGSLNDHRAPEEFQPGKEQKVQEDQ